MELLVHVKRILRICRSHYIRDFSAIYLQIFVLFVPQLIRRKKIHKYITIHKYLCLFVLCKIISIKTERFVHMKRVLCICVTTRLFVEHVIFVTSLLLICGFLHSTWKIHKCEVKLIAAPENKCSSSPFVHLKRYYYLQRKVTIGMPLKVQPQWQSKVLISTLFCKHCNRVEFRWSHSHSHTHQFSLPPGIPCDKRRCGQPLYGAYIQT